MRNSDNIHTIAGLAKVGFILPDGFGLEDRNQPRWAHRYVADLSGGNWIHRHDWLRRWQKDIVLKNFHI